MGSTATQTYHASYNTAVGYNALSANTTGYYSTANGYQSLYNNTTGYQNTANGMYSLRANSSGGNNVATCFQSLYSNTSGSQNVAVGVLSLLNNTMGYSNSAIGFSSGRYIADGSTANATSNTSIYLGAETKALADGDTNETVIGYNATGVGSNSVVLGADTITKTILKGNVGIGTTTPDANLTIDDSSNSVYNLHIKNGGGLATGLLITAGNSSSDASLLRIADITNATPFFTVTDGNSYFQNGNVGIGTTSPFAKLSVKGAGTTTGINFQTTNSNDTPLVTVLDSGNVGIGTASPGAKLEVFGDMIIGDVTNGSVFRYNPTTNTIVNGAHENSIGVGSSNSIIAAGGATASSNINSIGTDSYVTTISGGYDNTIGNDSPAATISGGAHHRIDTGGTHGTIGGGSTNTIQAGGDYGFIGAGLSNIVGGTYAFIGAGSNNVATGFRSAVMGGYSNDATGQSATIPCGWGNAASGDYSFAFGYRANAAAAGVVVFKDSVNAQYTVNTTNMFGANFAGGYQLLGGNVGIGTTSPFAKLSVVGDVVADYFNATSTTATSTFAGGFSVGTNKLVVDRSTGNVGIGTASPASSLTIYTANDNGLELQNAGSASKSWKLKSNGNDLMIGETGLGNRVTF